jgi:hypothetical protein
VPHRIVIDGLIGQAARGCSHRLGLDVVPRVHVSQAPAQATNVRN